MPTIHLGLGTNLGDRRENLRRALRALGRFVTVEAISSVYESEPVGYREQPEFWNIVVRATTDLEPHALLAAVKGIERELGREPSFRDAPRIIDIDLLLYDDRSIRTPDLTVPHPRLLERAFVLRPLAELDPERRVPGTGERIGDHLRDARALERAVPLFPGDRLLRPDEP